MEVAAFFLGKYKQGSLICRGGTPWPPLVAFQGLLTQTRSPQTKPSIANELFLYSSSSFHDSYLNFCAVIYARACLLRGLHREQ
jgi:hypothetical protein